MRSAIFLALAACGLARAADEPAVAVAKKRAADTIEVTAEKGRTVVAVRKSAIGDATIERTGDAWPAAVVLRLHLTGLEHFTASNGKTTLKASVSSTDSKDRVRLSKSDDDNTRLDAKSPFWMDVRMIGADGQPTDTIPLKDGHFEMTLPKAFFEGNPKAVALAWIDFYRR